MGERTELKPFETGDRVKVPGRFNCLIVRECWQEKTKTRSHVDQKTAKVVIEEIPGLWRVTADFESGYGWYSGLSHEFELDPTP